MKTFHSFLVIVIAVTTNISNAATTIMKMEGLVNMNTSGSSVSVSTGSSLRVLDIDSASYSINFGAKYGSDLMIGQYNPTKNFDSAYNGAETMLSIVKRSNSSNVYINPTGWFEIVEFNFEMDPDVGPIPQNIAINGWIQEGTNVSSRTKFWVRFLRLGHIRWSDFVASCACCVVVDANSRSFFSKSTDLMCGYRAFLFIVFF